MGIPNLQYIFVTVEFIPWNGRERKQSLDANITHKETGILLFNYILIIVTQLEMFRHSLGMH